MGIVIKAEDISKMYQIGEFSTGTISNDIQRWWVRIRGGEDPYLKLGEENDKATKSNDNFVWSLRDIGFDIEQGSAVGIVGRNGAGKSTLLKILSQVTTPTSGSIKVKGRIASLLEVGTGFHPELTGRENVFLNGAILGMRKLEIQRKFDEIVDFSGVERYIDTPVKRYSSGMYVRLAFAVAAHLESEILIVDEVLAVGDVEFQQKCLGKMGEVSRGEGRTVIFVSHNMEAVQKLCTSGIFLENGRLVDSNSISRIIERYLQRGKITGAAIHHFNIENTDQYASYPLTANVQDFQGTTLLEVAAYEEFQVKIQLVVQTRIEHFICAIGISTNLDFPLRTIWSEETEMEPGVYTIIFHMASVFLETGNYQLSLGISSYERSIFSKENFTTLRISDVASSKKPSNVVRIQGTGVILNTEKVSIHKNV
jgi:lipopolysaccharide transport system ATP-binding protein